MRQTFICASPYHVGDRLILSRRGAFERRIEFRRLSDQGRESVVLDRIVCWACMGAEIAERRGTGPPATASLLNETVNSARRDGET
jgi:hypothetical protein